MKNLLIYIVFSILSLSFFLLPIKAEKKIIKFGTLSPKSSSWGNLIRKTARDIYKKSDKTIVFKVFYGGVHGDEKEMEEKIRFKQLGGAFFTGNGLGAVVYESRILEIPGLIQNYQELDYVYPRILDELNIYFHKKGYHLIGLTDVGLAYFFSKKNVKSINDIKKSKMWTWKGDKLSSKIMSSLDIPAVPVSFSEVIPSLQTGFIDGVYATTTSLISLQWHREVNYMLDFPITLVSSGVVLSKNIWDQFKLDEQKMITEIVNKNLTSFKPIIRKSDQDSIKLLKEQGMVVNQSKDTIENIVIQSKNIMIEFPQPLKDKIKKLLKEIRK